MGLFSFGGSTSRSQSSGRSQSTSFSADEAFSRSGSESGSVSGGISRAGSEDASRATSRENIAFEDVFARLYGNAESSAISLDPSLLTTAANQLFTGGTDFLSRIGGDAGSEFLEGRLAEGNPVLQEQIDLLSQDIGEFFSEQVNPVITSDAIRGGQLGGGRQGVAQGLAAEAAGEAFASGAVGLRAADIAQRDAIASGISDRTLAGADVALAGIPALAGAADLGFGAGLEPAARLAAILGGPTVLGASDSVSRGTSFATAEDFARAFSESFGTSESRGVSSSQATSENQSTSKAKSLRFGFE